MPPPESPTGLFCLYIMMDVIPVYHGPGQEHPQGCYVDLPLRVTLYVDRKLWSLRHSLFLRHNA